MLFALAFARYTSSHPYYALPLIPILALAIGVVVGRLYDRLSHVRRLAWRWRSSSRRSSAWERTRRTPTIAAPSPPTQTIADYRRIGELTHHTTRAIIVNPSLAHPVMYWGWIVGQEWDLGEPVLPTLIDPSEKDYLIVVGNDALQGSPGLRAFARGRRVVAQTERFTIFALRETSDVGA